jgi:hypothetical protein
VQGPGFLPSTAKQKEMNHEIETAVHKS